MEPDIENIVRKYAPFTQKTDPTPETNAFGHQKTRKSNTTIRKKDIKDKITNSIENRKNMTVTKRSSIEKIKNYFYSKDSSRSFRHKPVSLKVQKSLDSLTLPSTASESGNTRKNMTKPDTCCRESCNSSLDSNLNNPISNYLGENQQKKGKNRQKLTRNDSSIVREVSECSLPVNLDSVDVDQETDQITELPADSTIRNYPDGTHRRSKKIGLSDLERRNRESKDQAGLNRARRLSSIVLLVMEENEIISSNNPRQSTISVDEEIYSKRQHRDSLLFNVNMPIRSPWNRDSYNSKMRGDMINDRHLVLPAREEYLSEFYDFSSSSRTLLFQSYFCPCLIYAAILSRVDMEYWKGKSSRLYLIMAFYTACLVGIFGGIAMLCRVIIINKINIFNKKDWKRLFVHNVFTHVMAFEYAAPSRPGLKKELEVKDHDDDDDHEHDHVGQHLDLTKWRNNPLVLIIVINMSIVILVILHRHIRLGVRKYYRMARGKHYSDWAIGCFCQSCNLLQNAREMDLNEIDFKMIDRV